MNTKILLSANSKKELYIDAINDIGVIAVAKYLADIDTEYDGLVLCGGNDINPELYNEEIVGAKNIDFERDYSEITLAKLFIEAKKPILGICRGCQLLNVIFGGTLHQDIPNSNLHCSFSNYDLIHSVNSVKGSIINGLYGDDFVVNSFHHQSINQVGAGFEITATAADNRVIEAIEHVSLPIFGVQWHPERMCCSKKRTDTVDGLKIFEYFVRMCEKGIGDKIV